MMLNIAELSVVRIVVGQTKEETMLCGVRWAREQTEGFEIIVPMLEKIYKNSNVLSIKYILHTVLNLHYKSIGKEGINLSFATESANDAGYQNILLYLHKGEVDSSTKFFLQLLNNFEDVEDLYRKMPLYKEDSECKFPGYNRDGDSICFAVNKRNISHQILYGEERGRRWDYIPVHIKKQWLLQMDDAYLMTSIPQISYNDCWDVEASLKKIITTNITIKRLKKYVVIYACMKFIQTKLLLELFMDIRSISVMV